MNNSARRLSLLLALLVFWAVFETERVSHPTIKVILGVIVVFSLGYELWQWAKIRRERNHKN